MVIKVPPKHIFNLGMQESTNCYDQVGSDARKQDCIFQGNPYGKRPDAMFRAILVRLVQCIDANASATADSAGSKQCSSDITPLQIIRDASQRAMLEPSHVCAMRCFKVQVQESGIDDVKWIFCSASETAVVQASRLLRDRGTILAPGIFLDYDSAPRGRRPKKIHHLLASLSFGSAKESKIKPISKRRLEGHGHSSPAHCRGGWDGCCCWL
eukprot:TRINITY_DN7974_c0_g1_i4.p1 TRINITY_DN7974_c0_g1~~TRINITY_DN7974_c0_g1_i4.p1  ORF type:complete len:212 (-),score=22.02 TRINITY_DN7974_c0_g1_i4:408-1043(-)